MDALSITQRKRSLSTTAFSSQEEDAASLRNHHLSNNRDRGKGKGDQSDNNAASLSSGLLGAAVANQIMTFDFASSASNQTFPFSIQSQEQPSLAFGQSQMESVQLNHEQMQFDIASVQWSPDLSLMAVEAQDGRLDILDNRCRLQTSLIDQPTATKEPRPGSSHCTISWAQRPQRLYYANDRTVMAWNSVVNRNSEIFEVGSRIDALAINTDDILLAVGQSTGRLEAVNRSSGNSIVLETPTKMTISKLGFSLFERSILGVLGNDPVLRFYDAGSTGSTSVLRTIESANEGLISDMAFSSSNRCLVGTASLNKHYTLYDIRGPKLVLDMVTDFTLTSLTFSSTSSLMALGSNLGKILLYDLRSTSHPLCIVDTHSSAPVSSVHFQGRPPSSKLTRHQTMNGQALKRQSSTGSKSTADATSERPTISTPILGSSSTTTSSKPVGIKSSGSQPSLNLNINLGARPRREIHSAEASGGGGAKGILEMFSSRRRAETTKQDDQDRSSVKQRRPTLPVSFLKGESENSPLTPAATSITIASLADSRSSTLPSDPVPSSSATLVSALSSLKGKGIIPITPTKEQRNNTHTGGRTSSSYPNSGTASPISFQMMQSRSPSGESSSSSLSSSPPGSPGRGGEGRGREESTPATSASAILSQHQPIKQHQYNTIPGTASPSGHSRTKRRKSVGEILANGGASSAPGTPSLISDEKMEQLRGQLVDSVRNVVLENPLERRQQVLAKGETVPTSSKMWPWPKSTESNSQQYQQEQVPKPIREPFSDLWTMAGQDHGVGSSSGHHSTSATSGAKSLLRRLGESALPASDHISTMTNMGSGQPLSTAPLGSTMSSFSTKLLENVVEGCLMDFREGIRNDIQNMHLELLRQFQIQKMEVETLLKKYSDLGELKDEIERLQEENRQLRLNY